jgi:hypothetical protein
LVSVTVHEFELEAVALPNDAAFPPSLVLVATAALFPLFEIEPLMLTMLLFRD